MREPEEKPLAFQERPHTIGTLDDIVLRRHSATVEVIGLNEESVTFLKEEGYRPEDPSWSASFLKHRISDAPPRQPDAFSMPGMR
ncbi:MAG: hypothetical protein ABI150_15255 [Nitrobacter sp.]